MREGGGGKRTKETNGRTTDDGRYYPHDLFYNNNIIYDRVHYTILYILLYSEYRILTREALPLSSSSL